MIKVSVPYKSHNNKYMWDYMTTICAQLNNINLAKNFSAIEASVDNVIYVIIDISPNMEGFAMFTTGAGAVGGVIGFIYGFSGMYSSAKEKDKEYRSSLENQKEENERAKRELIFVPEYKEKEKFLISNIDSCQDTLAQLYSMDIIFPKYRNFIAIYSNCRKMISIKSNYSRFI